jgi:hypothetical protein
LSAGWALAVVTSRAFRVSGPAAPAALLPLIDMANHSFDPNCEVVPVPGGVAMIAKKQVRCYCLVFVTQLINMANHSFDPNCEVVPVPGGVAMVAKKQVHSCVMTVILVTSCKAMLHL